MSHIFFRQVKSFSQLYVKIISMSGSVLLSKEVTEFSLNQNILGG